MILNQNNPPTLPMRFGLGFMFTCTLTISILMALASATGVLFSSLVYPARDLRISFVSNDLVNLILGLPFLLTSLALTCRGKLIGLLALSGGLLFVLYGYLVYVLAVPFGLPFLLDVALVTSSACALVSLLLHIDSSWVKRRLAGVVSERLTGGILTGFGVLFLLRAIHILLVGFTHRSLIARPEFAVNVADLLIAPFWIVGGTLLTLRKAFGYVAAFSLFFQANLLFITLIAFLLLQPLLSATTIRLGDVAVILTMGLVCFVPLAQFVRRSWSISRP